MKKYTYTFAIDKPCSESWDAMSASEKGKFCMNCQHEVIDFSSLRDDEIIRVMEKAMGSVCGRFRNSQLNRPMYLSTNIQRPFSIRAIIAGVVLLTIITPSISEAREMATKVESKISLAERKAYEPVLPSDSTYIYKGRVLSVVGNSGLKGVKVFLADSSQMVVTDSTGNFELSIPANLSRTTYIVKVVDDRYIYEPNEVIVDGSIIDYNAKHNVYLLPSESITMGKVYIPSAEEKPAKPDKH